MFPESLMLDEEGVPVFIGNLKKHMRADRHAPGSAGVLTRFGSATLPA